LEAKEKNRKRTEKEQKNREKNRDIHIFAQAEKLTGYRLNH